MLAIANLETALKDFEGIIASGDKQAVPIIQSTALNYVGDIEEAMVKGFPFSVPAEYANLPQLKVHGWCMGGWVIWRGWVGGMESVVVGVMMQSVCVGG